MENNIIGIDLRLCAGYYEIKNGNSFETLGEDPFLCFIENNIMHIIGDPRLERGSGAVIKLDSTCEPQFIRIKADGAHILADSLTAGTVTLELRDCNISFKPIEARRIVLSSVYCTGRLLLRPSIGADISCGFGSVTAELCENRRGYRIDAQRSAGQLVIDGAEISGHRTIGAENGVPVKAGCGLGRLEIIRRAPN